VLVAQGWNVDYSVSPLISGCKYCSSGRGKLITSDGDTGHAVGCLRARLLAAFSADPGKNLLRWVVTGGWSLFENCTVDASICGQVFKGARWMPWHQEPMKDVGGHDSPRGVVNQALIRGFPNGETRQSSWAVTHT
jgi:hypothetical protein